MQAFVPGPVGGPTFIRLLARAAERPFPPPGLPPAGRLGEWIDWPRAVTLSRALDQQPADPARGEPASAAGLAEECARVRAALAADIDNGPGPVAADAGFSPFQQHIQAMQRAMQSATGRLRGDLRERLAGGCAQQARLAELDAAMEAALSPRETSLLSAVPALLAAHYEREQRPATFHRELRELLLAELDLRFQPVEGLLAALRSP
ncbi:MAG: DUF3348 family protein [Luteimonas sp.]